jgi:glucose/arabinose dehydrogenase
MPQLRRSIALVLGLAGLLVTPACAQQQVETLTTEAGPVAVQNLTDGLDHPWGMAFLPDGRLLVTERSGALRILGSDGTLSGPVGGTPEVYAQRQGGLLDVALDPDFGENGYVYLSYAKPGPGGQAATAVGRGRWEDDRIAGFEDLFVQEPWVRSGLHFGSRIAFSPDGYLFVTTGDRGQREPAQDLGGHIGKLLRLNRDGSVPDDNPFVGQADARDEIWSYGHRNIQGAAVHPETGAVWTGEFGPRGGDEINRPEPGANYGWPLVSWGMHYDGRPIPDPPTRPDLADAVAYWVPAISPSGMAFYTGDLFPEWTGDLFIGGLSSQSLVRVALDGDTVTHEERIPIGARVRDVESAPDGSLYLLVDSGNGNVWRLAPPGPGE